MAKLKKNALQVESDGSRRYIRVPEGRANDLHDYLRGSGVHSAPPQPAYTGYDAIELAKGVDITAVQALLNDF